MWRRSGHCSGCSVSGKRRLRNLVVVVSTGGTVVKKWSVRTRLWLTVLRNWRRSYAPESNLWMQALMRASFNKFDFFGRVICWGRCLHVRRPSCSQLLPVECDQEKWRDLAEQVWCAARVRHDNSLRRSLLVSGCRRHSDAGGQRCAYPTTDAVRRPLRHKFLELGLVCTSCSTDTHINNHVLSESLRKSTVAKHSNRRLLFSKQTELTDAGPNPGLNFYVVGVDI